MPMRKIGNENNSKLKHICSRCGFPGHYAFEHATGTMDPFHVGVLPAVPFIFTIEPPEGFYDARGSGQADE